jgi:hypothetical protein
MLYSKWEEEWKKERKVRQVGEVGRYTAAYEGVRAKGPSPPRRQSRSRTQRRAAEAQL